jgi:DNA-binding CsgD family transcriptional regulator
MNNYLDINKIIYENELQWIGNIKLTIREVDVMACMIYGRSGQNISSLLSISSKTVSAHIYNIRMKLGYIPKDHIIDFIEKSGKLQILKQYYYFLIIKKLFDNNLLKIAEITRNTKVLCILNYIELDCTQKKTLDQIKKDLAIVGIILEEKQNISLEIKYYIQIDNKDCNLIMKKNQLHLLFSKVEGVFPTKNSQYFDFTELENYYLSLMLLIKKIIDRSEITHIISKFEIESNNISTSLQDQNIINSIKIKQLKVTKRLIVGIVIVIFIIIFLVVTWHFTSQNELIISTLNIPNSNVFVDRRDIIEKIDKCLSKYKGIKTVAIVGIGGSGKTTIARQYAQNKNYSLVWEINAETKQTLIESIEKLAYSISSTEEGRQEFRVIQQLKDDLIKEEALVQFLSHHLKKYDWLLIYDNVENFNDIQKFVPYNPKSWGNGDIIITTKNFNIAYSSYLLSDNIIQLNDLDKSQRLELFIKILKTSEKNKKLSFTQNDDIEQLLQKIPPFPLDVITAAYYIKETDTSYIQYLEYMSKMNADFLRNQEEVLNDIGKHTNSRYKILSLQIENIIKVNPKFKDLLFFISLVNSQNIPKDLLIMHSNEFTVNRLLQELKKYSLIVSNGEKFSLHRNIQSFILEYLTIMFTKDQEMDKQVKIVYEILHKIAIAQEEKEDVFFVKELISHYEFFLSHRKLFNNTIIESISCDLAVMYYYLGRYKESVEVLEKIVNSYTTHYVEDIKTQLRVFVHLSNSLAELNEKEKLENIIPRIKKILQSQVITNQEKSWAYGCLSYICELIGLYVDAKFAAEMAIKIDRTTDNFDSLNYAKLLAYLSNANAKFGEYEIALDEINKSIKIFHNHKMDNSIRSGWVKVIRGRILVKLGKIKEAISSLEESLDIYKKHVPIGHSDMAWVQGYLAYAYLNVGNYSKVADLLTKNDKIYNLQIIPNMNYLMISRLYFGIFKSHIGELDTAEKILENVLSYYQAYYGNDHIETATVMLYLSDIFYKKQNFTKYQMLLKQAKKIFKNSKVSYAYDIKNLLISR